VSNDKAAATYHPYTERQSSFDEWLHDYKPLRGRARMWHKIKRFSIAIFGIAVTLVIIAALGMGALMVAGVLFVLFAGLLG
jgi:Flp pilus assembly protein TadB